MPDRNCDDARPDDGRCSTQGEAARQGGAVSLAKEDLVIMQQDAFAPMPGSNEIFLLGKAIKYAGLVGKEVRIIPSARRPS